MDDRVSTWEDYARPDGRGVPQHQRQSGSAAPERPAARLIELTREVNVARGYLLDACAELRTLTRQNESLKREYDRFHTMRDTSFGGVTMAQVWVDLFLWEAVLNENPDLKGIVEIGTWEGGFSQWLEAQAVTRDLRFVTYDAVVPERPPRRFQRCDVFAEADRVIDTIQGMEPAIVFCDGGNKPRELRTFGAPALRDPRSLIAVHDWGTEMMPSDVPPTLEMMYESFCVDLGSVTRVFKVRT